MSSISGDSASSVSSESPILNGEDCPTAIFICRPQSHPFNERHVPVTKSMVKIGRSVAKNKPTSRNAIFDCKVLSRNHAVLWYENNKFMLKDTNSSNGTFVNSQRLGKGNEESQPREIFSGDIIQFGVDVMENSRQVTHGCIISIVTLLHADGSEAKRLPVEQGVNRSNVSSFPMSQEQVYQLSQYLQEALHREQVIDSKMESLKEMLATLAGLTDSNWTAILNEERLLGKIEMLENQLAVVTCKDVDAGSVQTYLYDLLKKKEEMEETLTTKLEEHLQERNAAQHKLCQLERSYHESQEECDHLRESYDKAMDQLKQLSSQYDKEVQNFKEKLNSIETEKTEVQTLYSDLQNKYDTLQVEKDFADIQRVSNHVQHQNTSTQADLPLLEGSLLTEDKENQSLSIEERLKVSMSQVSHYHALLKEKQDALEISLSNSENLQRKLETLRANFCSDEMFQPVKPIEEVNANHFPSEINWFMKLIRRQDLEKEDEERVENFFNSLVKNNVSSPHKGELALFTRHSSNPDLNHKSLTNDSASQFLSDSIGVNSSVDANSNTTVTDSDSCITALQAEHSALQEAYSELEASKSRLQSELDDKSSVRGECSELRRKVALIEAEMRTSREEYDQLAAEYQSLQSTTSAELLAYREQCRQLADKSRLGCMTSWALGLSAVVAGFVGLSTFLSTERTPTKP